MNRRQTLGDIGERAVIAMIDSIVGETSVALGIGDDAAAFAVPRQSDVLATTDSLVQDIHFRLSQRVGRRLGETALAVNLSDIAAMGATPGWALVSLVAPANTPVRFVRDLFSGLRSMADRFDVAIVGGNVSASPGPVVVDVTLLGFAPADQRVKRSGAQIGDVVAVTGTLGGAAGARLLAGHGRIAEDEIPIPEPRVAAGQKLAASGVVHAMLDISDGLATDIHHLADASRVGAVIYAASVPVGVAAREAARLGKQHPLDLALFGGEDYELLIAMPEDRLPAAVEAAGDVSLTVVGTILAPDHGVLVEDVGGARMPLEPRGWEHFRSD